MKKRHLLLTGLPGCGKTTLLMRLAAYFAGRHPVGFYTEEIREQGVRQGFRLVSLDGREGLLAHVRFRNRQRVGRYGVDVAGFEKFLDVSRLDESNSPLVFVDEIGKMECLSPQFVALLRKLFDSEKTVIATIAAKGTGFIAEVKMRTDCELVALTPENRESLWPVLCRRLAVLVGESG